MGGRARDDQDRASEIRGEANRRLRGAAGVPTGVAKAWIGRATWRVRLPATIDDA